MPSPLLPLLLRSLLSRLLLPVARLARQHLLPLLRRLARRLSSQDLREALLGCLLFVLSQQQPPDAGETSRVDHSQRKQRLGPQKYFLQKSAETRAHETCGDKRIKGSPSFPKTSLLSHGPSHWASSEPPGVLGSPHLDLHQRGRRSVRLSGYLGDRSSEASRPVPALARPPPRGRCLADTQRPSGNTSRLEGAFCLHQEGPAFCLSLSLSQDPLLGTTQVPVAPALLPASSTSSLSIRKSQRKGAAKQA